MCNHPTIKATFDLADDPANAPFAIGDRVVDTSQRYDGDDPNVAIAGVVAAVRFHGFDDQWEVKILWDGDEELRGYTMEKAVSENRWWPASDFERDTPKVTEADAEATFDPASVIPFVDDVGSGP